MKLIIAEKPSVARSIGSVIGAAKKEDGYLEGGGYLVSWCYGHLVELAKPDAYGDQYKKWTLEELPLIPESWITQVVHDKGAKKQFNILKSLMNRNDVLSLIEATDAGREGELIFRLVYSQANCTKPFERLWISSMEKQAIENGMANLHPGTKYDTLAASAYARSEWDWMFGMTLTRLNTLLYAPYKTVFNTGRVQTPTLNLCVQRAFDIQNYTKRKYFNIEATFEEFSGVCRCEDKKEGEELARAIKGELASVVSFKKEKKTKGAPKLYDLTTLQREANRFFGYSAQKTLDIAQELYEKKLQTYPRTESKYLTEEMEDSTRALINQVKELVDEVQLNHIETSNIKAVINNSKVTDHHAIIPTAELTKETLNKLSHDEKNIMLVVCFRLLEAVGEKHTYIASSTVLSCCKHSFEAKGKSIDSQGWTTIENTKRRVLGLKAFGPEENYLPELTQGQELQVIDSKIVEKETEPPKPYTEDTLLAAMETCGKKIDDEALREAMKDSGLGTPATRAATIEGLINNGFLVRKKKTIEPTELAFDLIEVVDSSVKSPELTGTWEQKLNLIAKGELSYEQATEEIKRYLTDIVKRNRSNPNPKYAEQAGRRKGLCMCPKCSNDIVATKNSYMCSSNKFKKNDDGTITRTDGCGFILNGTIASKRINEQQAIKIIEGKTVKVTGLKSKTGKSFEAGLKLEEDNSGRVEFVFEKKK